MVLKTMTSDLVFDLIDTNEAAVDIINNVIRITSRNNIPFSESVANFLINLFDKKDFDVEFDDNTKSVIYIKPLNEALVAEIRELVASPVVEYGYVTTFRSIDEEVED